MTLLFALDPVSQSEKGANRVKRERERLLFQTLEQRQREREEWRQTLQSNDCFVSMICSICTEHLEQTTTNQSQIHSSCVRRSKSIQRVGFRGGGRENYLELDDAAAATSTSPFGLSRWQLGVATVVFDPFLSRL